VADVDREPDGRCRRPDFVTHSRIGVLHALNRNVKGLCGRFITVSRFFRWNSRFDSRVSAASISF
jgi:hypothetical protein